MSAPDPAAAIGAGAYDDAFYDDIDAWAAAGAGVVVPLVSGLLGGVPGSVVDLGCGTGTWLAAWTRAGTQEVVGVDGPHVDRARLSIADDRFHAVDLDVAARDATARPGALSDRRFDLAMSLEVAEHLDPSSADAFTAWLTSLAPVILFSAAVPGQGGVGHVNEQWPAYWATRFAAHGYRVADVVRPLVWDEPDVMFFYAQNLLLFACDDRFDEIEPAFPTRDLDGVPAPLPLVHPGLLDALNRLHEQPGPPASLPSLARQLPGAGLRAVRRRTRGQPA